MPEQRRDLAEDSEIPQPWKDLIAKRLVDKTKTNPIQTEEHQIREIGETIAAVAVQEPIQPIGDFVKIEKNLASLGFFTPSSKKIKEVTKKTIRFTRVIDNKRVEVTATILPSAEYGLPITADQDTYFALFKIATEMHRKQRIVTNPIGFHSAELLYLQGKSAAGYHYKQLAEQLMRILTATVVSEGTVYLAGKKVWAKDAFHVFDRVVLFGKQLPDGKLADKNYVWLSDWQLENINNNYLLPIELETYRQLKNHIAKALVPLLQIWLYASREEGSFEKRYDELCQILNIRQYRHLSKIQEKVGPSLDELKAHGYIADWRTEKTSDEDGYKIVFVHGDKFHRDRRRRLAQKEQGSETPRKEFRAQPAAADISAPLLSELTKRGISEKAATHLVQNLAADQQIVDQLEYGDFLINQAEPGKFHNPTGFYIYLVKDNIVPPDTFESTRQRRLREQAKQEHRREESERLRLELAYKDYKRGEIDRYIASNYDADQLQQLVGRKKEELMTRRPSLYQAWPEETLIALAQREVRSDLAQWVPFTNFETFCEQNRTQPEQLTLSDAGQESPPPFVV